jgi:hypothetical protein
MQLLRSNLINVQTFVLKNFKNKKKTNFKIVRVPAARFEVGKIQIKFRDNRLQPNCWVLHKILYSQIRVSEYK